MQCVMANVTYLNKEQQNKLFKVKNSIQKP